MTRHFCIFYDRCRERQRNHLYQPAMTQVLSIYVCNLITTNSIIFSSQSPNLSNTVSINFFYSIILLSYTVNLSNSSGFNYEKQRDKIIWHWTVSILNRLLVFKQRKDATYCFHQFEKPWTFRSLSLLLTYHKVSQLPS